MYNFISKIPLSIKVKIQKIDLELPQGKYIKDATICLVKFNSSSGVAYVLCQLGNTKQEQKTKISVSYGLDQKATEMIVNDNTILNNGEQAKVWAYDALSFSSNTVGYVCLLEENLKIGDSAENETED